MILKIKYLVAISLLITQFSLFAQHKKVEKGIASYYHDDLRLHKTANGELYYPSEMTAAHLTLPFNSIVKVLNLSNNKSVIVRINDRGPFIENRIIDLSRAAADSLDILYQGLARVEIRVVSLGQTSKTPKETILLASNVKVSAKRSKINKINTVEKTVIDSSLIAKIENSDTSAYIGNRNVYGVQIGSFKKRSNMEKLSKSLKIKFIEKFNVQEINKGNTLFYRMILGEFSNENNAIVLKKKIEKEFPECFIVKYNN